MAIFVLPYSRINHTAGLVLTLFCLPAVSCDFPQGFVRRRERRLPKGGARDGAVRTKPRPEESSQDGCERKANPCPAKYFHSWYLPVFSSIDQTPLAGLYAIFM
jgi:hypothetical protein